MAQQDITLKEEQKVIIRANAQHSRRMAQRALTYGGYSGVVEEQGDGYIGVRLDVDGKRRYFLTEDVEPAN